MQETRAWYEHCIVRFDSNRETPCQRAWLDPLELASDQAAEVKLISDCWACAC